MISIARAITGWLQEKVGRRKSRHTSTVYAQPMADFRAELQRGGLDLDSPVAEIAQLAQG
jgi:hypothetical protein